MNDHVIVELTADLGDELLKVLGQITVCFGQLEHTLAMSIKRTTPDMTLDEAEKLRDGLIERSEKAQERFEVWAQNQDSEADFWSFMGKARALAQQRHDVVHAFWGKDDRDEIYWGRLAERRPVSIDVLKHLRNELYLLSALINHQTRPDLTFFDIPHSSS